MNSTEIVIFRKLVYRIAIKLINPLIYVQNS